MKNWLFVFFFALLPSLGHATLKSYPTPQYPTSISAKHDPRSDAESLKKIMFWGKILTIIGVVLLVTPFLLLSVIPANIGTLMLYAGAILFGSGICMWLINWLSMR